MSACAQADRLVELHVEVEAAVVAVRQLRDARDADVVDAAAELEIADDGRARDDDHGGVRLLLHDGVRDAPGTGADGPSPKVSWL